MPEHPTFSLSGPDAPKPQVVVEGEFTIGRDATCSLWLPHASVSRRHAALRVTADGRVEVEDFGSRNGTFVNEVPVTRKVVQPADQIRMGHYQLVYLPTTQAPAVEAADPLATIDDNLEISPTDADGPARLERRQLRTLQQLISALATASSVSEVYALACDVLLGMSGTKRACIAKLGPSGLPVILSDAIAAGQVAVPVSRTLLRRTAESRQVFFATPNNPQAGALTTSIDAHGAGLALICAPLETATLSPAAVYVAIPLTQMAGNTAEFVGTMALQIGIAAQAAERAAMRVRTAETERELEMGRRVQARLAPPARLTTAAGEVETVYLSCKAVGGDYCDVFETRDGHVLCVIGDVAGKGLPAALLATYLHALVRSTTHLVTDLGEAFTLVNQWLMARTAPERFATLAAMKIDPASGGYTLINAGHVAPIVVTPDGRVEEIECEGNLPLGVMDLEFTPHRGILARGATLVLMTDGITETFAPDGEMLNPQGVCQWLKTQGIGSASATALVEYCQAFAQGGEPGDDRTILTLRLA